MAAHPNPKYVAAKSLVNKGTEAELEDD